jgi:hypothetical protein
MARYTKNAAGEPDSASVDKEFIRIKNLPADSDEQFAHKVDEWYALAKELEKDHDHTIAFNVLREAVNYALSKKGAYSQQQKRELLRNDVKIAQLYFARIQCHIASEYAIEDAFLDCLDLDFPNSPISEIKPVTNWLREKLKVTFMERRNRHIKAVQLEIDPVLPWLAKAANDLARGVVAADISNSVKKAKKLVSTASFASVARSLAQARKYDEFLVEHTQLLDTLQASYESIPRTIQELETALVDYKPWLVAGSNPAPVPPAPPFQFNELFLICSITQEVMLDPVNTVDGHTYERAAITEWLSRKNTSPITGLVLASKVLTPNHALRAMCLPYRQAHGLPCELPAQARPQQTQQQPAQRTAQRLGLG